MLDRFNINEIQALYGLGLNDDLKEAFYKYDFDIDKVISGNTLRFTPDYVVSLRKNR